MFSNIFSSLSPPPVLFSRSQVEAKTEVKKLRNTLMQELSGAGWKFFISPAGQSNIRSEDRRFRSDYIQSLLEAAYPDVDSFEMEMTHRGFATYLTEKHLTAEELLDQINELHQIQVQEEAFEAGKKTGAIPFAEDEPEKIRVPLPDFLASKEVFPYFTQRLGEGNFGVVVSTEVKGEEGKYVYKHEKRDVSKALTGRGSSFWREGDCAAARLNDISHVPKPLFFIFRIVQEGQPEELHYVPANYVKAFGMKLPPGTTVFLEGQLMERATGESLDKIMLKNAFILSPITGKHFTNIVRGLFNIMQELQAHNLVHRDIKPENIFYNPQTGEVTLLDFGSATKLRKKEKADDGSHLYKPTSREVKGTPKYISPRVLQQKPYGSEVDFFSFAMTVLELINKVDFINFNKKRFPAASQSEISDALFERSRPTEYLDGYLKAIGAKEPQQQNSSQPSFLTSLFSWIASGGDQPPRNLRSQSLSTSSARSASGNSTTERKLNQNPQIKEIIDLAFRVSGGGNEGAAAYEQLKSLPYFQANASPTMTDSPATTSSARTTDSPLIVGVSK